ncbi:MAG: DUF4411 family protein [Chitinophagaceae bacterium]
MPGLFADPYKYVIDSSALFDLKRNYPLNVFKGVWEKFNGLCKAQIIISVREVYNEIKRGSDWLKDWADEYHAIFLEPTSLEEYKLIGTLQEKYPSWIDVNSDKPAADPFVIASAYVRKLNIIQHESLNKNLQKLQEI